PARGRLAQPLADGRPHGASSRKPPPVPPPPPAVGGASFGPALRPARADGFGPCSASPRTAHSFLGLLGAAERMKQRVSASLNRSPTRPSALARLRLPRLPHSPASLGPPNH